MRFERRHGVLLLAVAAILGSLGWRIWRTHSR